MSNYGSPHRIDPILLFLFRLCNEKHVAVVGGNFKRKGFVNGILSAFDGQAAVDFDNASRFCVLRAEREKERG